MCDLWHHKVGVTDGLGYDQAIQIYAHFMSLVHMHIDMVVEAPASAELQLVSVFARIPTTHPP